MITDEQLKHLAIIAHICYKSLDLSLRCITILENRGIVPKGSTGQYTKMINPS